MSPAVDHQTEQRLFALYASRPASDDAIEVTPRSVDAVGASVIRVLVRQVTRDTTGAVVDDREVQHLYMLDEHGEPTRMMDENG